MAGLILPVEYWGEMEAHVQRSLPEEACGLLAGMDDAIERVYPIRNQLHSTTRFRMDPQEQVTAMLDAEEHGWDLLAIYHSHPHGPRVPSPTDLQEFRYPGCLYLIWFREEGKWDCNAYQIIDQQAQSITMELRE